MASEFIGRVAFLIIRIAAFLIAFTVIRLISYVKQKKTHLENYLKKHNLTLGEDSIVNANHKN